ncbi:MAG TPA: cohesin domain-containing protein [Bryobacteraceae bacterium]|nr:cohesin domain-containing protein [Bryobacteraceae bacterium]
MKHALLLSLLLLAGTTYAFSDTISVSPASSDVMVGQAFTVDIDIDDISDLFAYQFTLTFDPAVLAADSIVEGDLFAGTGNSFFLPGTIDNSAGSIAFTADTLLSGPGVDGPGTLAIATFTAIGTGTSSFDFPDSDLFLVDSSLNQIAVTSSSGTADAATPEPATLSLLAAGLGFLIFGAWRRSVSPGRLFVPACRNPVQSKQSA